VGNLRPSSTPLDTPRRTPMFEKDGTGEERDKRSLRGLGVAVRNFPRQTLKIGKVSLVVVGS
jgi:hypothetical protein